MKSLVPILTILCLLVIPAAGEPDMALNVIHDQDYVLCCGEDFNGSRFCESMTYYKCYSFRGRVVSDCSECEHYRPGE